MEKIASFQVNHLDLLRGVYRSRADRTPSGDVVTTFDIRMSAPNREPALTPEAFHAMEHLAATWLRNDAEWGSRVVYWGPMGCCTGNYLLLSGDLQPMDIAPMLRRMFQWIAEFEGDVPGATPRDCGNYSFMDLPEARRQAARYLNEVLADLGPHNTTYPQ